SRASGELACHLQRTFDSFCPAVGEIHALERSREKLGEPSRQHNLALDHILAVHHDVQMASRLLPDRGEHLGMPVAEGRDADPRDEIEIAPPVRRDQPRTVGARYLHPDRCVGSLRQILAEEIAKLTHRAPTIISKNRPPPWRQSSGGDCISPGAHTYGIPIDPTVAPMLAASDSSPATAIASIRPDTAPMQSRN